MKLTQNDVDHVAKLARLDLTQEEEEKLAVELSSILDYAATLQEVELDEVKPMHGVHVGQTMMRIDVCKPSLPQEVVLHNAPEAEEDQFKVPPIWEG